MLRLARVYVRDRAVAEEVVQEAWLGVLHGIERFEGRSSLRTWLHRIVANLAKTRAVREARSVPFSALAGGEVDEEGPSVPPERFRGPGDRWAGHWAVPPEPWGRPDQQLLSAETRARGGGRDRRPARGAATGDHAAGRGGLERGGGV